MTKYLLIVAGLLVVNQAAALPFEDCSSEPDPRYCESLDKGARDAQLREIQEQQKEAEYQRSRPVQVIGPEGVHTYYPSNDGRTWTNYGGIDTRR